MLLMVRTAVQSHSASLRRTKLHAPAVKFALGNIVSIQIFLWGADQTFARERYLAVNGSNAVKVALVHKHKSLLKFSRSELPAAN